MTRGQRVVNAFINCVKTGHYDYDYAVTLIDDNSKYGYLTQEEKDVFYKEFEPSNEATEEEIVSEADETVETE